MKLKNIELPMEQIKAFCDRWQVIEFALFGSILGDDFRPDSDIDVLDLLQKSNRRVEFVVVDASNQVES